MSATIYARATAPGVAGLAVIRISGPDAFEAAVRLCGPLPSPRTARLRRLRAEDGSVLDEALVIAFEAGASFTGERTVELQCHGAPVVVAAITDALSRDGRLRAAEAGEFARRAFENGRVDLIELEGLSALLAAETELQRRQAVGLMHGRAHDMAGRWSSRIREMLALLEGAIEFSDEVPEEVVGEARRLAEDLLRDMEPEVAGLSVSERLADGFRVAVIGPPNVGKSSLFNKIAGRQAAIVTEIPGTTRDLLELRLDLGGLPVTLVDTAGLRETEDPVERIGVERARDARREADLVLRLSDAPDEPANDRELVLVSKSDIRPGDLSARTGEGIDTLLAAIAERLDAEVAQASVFPRQRQAEHVSAAFDRVSVAVELLSSPGREEMVSAELWAASAALDRLVGRLDVEEVLDDVFAQFCIGK